MGTNNLPKKNLPPILYHYTPMKGLLGIVNSKSIWATNIYYLNDAAEYEHAAELMNREIEERLRVLPLPPAIRTGTEITDINQLERTFLEDIRWIIQDLRHFHIYICSFSKNGDQLSQWRGYCPNGNCLSVGFKTSYLIAHMKKHNFHLVKCIYKRDEQEKIIREAFDESISNLTSELKEIAPKKMYKKTKEISIKKALKLLEIIPRIKHETFQEEEEWRFFSHLQEERLKFVKFREGTSMIVPYVEIPLAGKESTVGIRYVIVGPTPHVQLSRRSVKVLLHSKGYKGYKITLSKAPYRTW